MVSGMRMFKLIVLSIIAIVLAVPAKCEKVFELLNSRDMASPDKIKGFYPPVLENVKLAQEGANWIRADFEPKASAPASVLFEFDYMAAVPPFNWRMVPDGSKEWPNVWLGYDSFSFDYLNFEKEPVNAVVLIQDWVGWVAEAKDSKASEKERPPVDPLVFRYEVVLKPGRGSISVDLTRPMWTSNKVKGISLDDIRAFGLEVVSPLKKSSIGLGKFRLVSKSAKAGVFEFPQKAGCGNCNMKFSDVYAPYCAFCGEEMKDYKRLPEKFPKFGEQQLIVEAIDGGGGSLNDGGGHNSTASRIGPSSVSFAHYDVNYNQPKGSGNAKRKSLVWEHRYYLKFDILEKISGRTRIKKAELWLFGTKRSDDYFNGKPWNPGVLIYSVNPEFNGWSGNDMNWQKMPPYEKLIFVGGQHPGPASQNPKLKTTSLDGTKWLAMDITEYVQEAVNKGQKVITLGLAAFTPDAAAAEPHGHGHHISAHGPANKGPRSPKIVIDLEK